MGKPQLESEDLAFIFATRDGAKVGGEELKKRFPMLQIRIYDAQTHAREDI